MLATQQWIHFDGTATCPVPRDAANPTSAEKEAMKQCTREDIAARSMLSGRLPDWVMLAVCRHKTAKAQWDALIKRFGHPGNPNVNTPEGVAPAEPDSTPGEDTTTNPYAPAHLEGVGLDPSMDGKEDHTLEVEEEGIAGENASVERDIGPCVKLQIPGVSPLATHEDIGLLTSPSPSSSPLTPEAASMQCSPVANTGTSATPNNDSAEDAEEAFHAETSGAEDEEAFDRAGLEGRLVKEDEEWDANEEAGVVTTSLMEDAPCTESRPAPHNALHAHTPTSKAASTQRSPGVNSGTPGIPEPEDRGADWDPLLHDTLPPDEAAEPLTHRPPEQIRAPTKAGGQLESLRGKTLWRAMGQTSPVLVRAPEGKMPVGEAHGRPPDLANLSALGSTVWEPEPDDPKAHVRVHQARRPVFDEGARMRPDPWPNLGVLNASHAPAPNHTLAALGALEEEEDNLQIIPPRGEHAAERPSRTLLERI